MDKNAIDCMAQHIKTFHAQAMDEIVADFGEACQTCPHMGNCSYNWISVMEPLLGQSAIRISAMHPEHLNKPGNETMGEIFKKVRKDNRLKQVDIAKELQTSQSYISQIENNQTIPTKRFIKLFCLQYGIDSAGLLQ